MMEDRARSAMAAVTTKPWLASPRAEALFRMLAIFTVGFALVMLGIFLMTVLGAGLPRISWQFLTSFPSRLAEKAGVLAALAGSFYLMILTIVIALPVGVGAAIYLEEFAGKSRLTRLIEVTIANLAGVPSIIYGLLGLQLFVRYCGFGRSLLAGALTLSLLILPVIIIAAREALRNVPQAIRAGALALGATKWQTIFYQVLPLAIPGIMTGCILAFSRAIGETAPLITMGALTYVAFLPDGLFSPFTALPIQAFNWVSRPQEAFHANAAGAIAILLCLLLLLNFMAIVLRVKFQKKLKY
jgi:phosphate transport system permease protein